MENHVVFNENDITKRITQKQVKTTISDFYKKQTSDKKSELIIKTTEETEARASHMLDLAEAAMARLFGSNSKFDVSVITSQTAERVSARISRNAVAYVASACGISSASSPEEIESFVFGRLLTEIQLLLLTFHESDLLEDPVISVKIGDRTLRASRAQRFR